MNEASFNLSIRTFKSSTSTSFGECNTIIMEPNIHSKQPNFPNKLSFSFRNFEAITDVTKTLKAPKGVTREAGANAYAAKFAASPIPTGIQIKKLMYRFYLGIIFDFFRIVMIFLLVNRPAHQSHCRKYPNPPALALKLPVLLSCISAFFLIIKLDPIKNDDDIANARPM